jgi:hypothetical protein
MHRKTRRLLVVSLAVLAVGGVAAGGVALAGRSPSVSDEASESTAGGTPAAPSSGEAMPAATTQPAPGTPSAAAMDPVGSGAPTATPGEKAQVALAYAEWDAAGSRLEAAGFVADVIQSGGVCTVTAIRNGTVVEVAVDAEADATTTNCGVLTVPGDRLVAGDWQVALSYRSATHQGTSQPLTVTVPAR